MDKKEAKELFKKYQNNQCSPEEIALLHNFLDSYQNQDSFWSDLSFEPKLQQDIWRKITAKTNQQNTNKKFKFRHLLKYAALLVFVLGTVFLGVNLFNEKAPQIDDDPIVIKIGNNEFRKIIVGGNETLRGDDGNIRASQNENQMIYYANPAAKKKVYNEILVPKGKTFSLLLSDGSLVRLNSDTSLKYPVSFISGETRKVFLMGEAYFEVAKDSENPFVVVSQGMDIQVLGTHFNVSSYENQEEFTVLVEGSVAVKERENLDETSFQIIAPGQKATLKNKALLISDVNVADYLGWLKGYLVFNDEAFKRIRKRIERRFNVLIENDYEDLEEVRFRGSFENETIEDILNTFKESADFEYEIIDNRILIKKTSST